MRAALLSLALASTALSSCTSSALGTRIEGAGPYTSTERSVPDFKEISLAGGMKLDVRVGSGPRVVIHADENLHEYIKAEVDGDELEIWFEQPISTKNEMLAEIEVPSLKGLDIAGSSVMDVQGLSGESFSIEVAGSGRGTFQGAVDRLEVDIAGSSNLDLFAVEAKEASIDIAGSGKVRVHAQEVLDVDVAGSGTVLYRGDPKVTTDTAGSAKVERDS